METVQDQQDLQWIVKTFIQHSNYFYRFDKFRRRPAKSESPTCVDVTKSTSEKVHDVFLRSFQKFSEHLSQRRSKLLNGSVLTGRSHNTRYSWTLPRPSAICKRVR